jgi:hypothetical protein
LPDIFDEVEEDLRAERAKRLAQRWGGLALAVALVAVVAVGGWQGWRWYEGRNAAQAAETFLTLNRAAEQPGADLATISNGFAALGRDAPSGYRTLARDLPGATALWEAVALDAEADRLYRDLATLLSVTHAIDTGDPAALSARLGPLLAEGNPWRASAREAAALLAIRRGQSEEARRILEALASDQSAPSGIRERAQRVAAGLRG